MLSFHHYPVIEDQLVKGEGRKLLALQDYTDTLSILWRFMLCDMLAVDFTSVRMVASLLQTLSMWTHFSTPVKNKWMNCVLTWTSVEATAYTVDLGKHCL